MKIEIADKGQLAAAIQTWPVTPMTAILFGGERFWHADWGAIARAADDSVSGLATVAEKGEGTGRPTIIGIYVLRSQRRQGIGAKLLAAVVEEARARALLPLLYEALTPSGLYLAQAGGYGPDELEVRDLSLICFD